ncbi:MAG: triose-phosphate isomerase [Polyangiaceae bacterium]
MNPSRKPLIAGNWKMFHGGPSGVMLAAECVKIAAAAPRVEIVIAPPYTALAACAAECHESHVGIAAQNVHAKDQGAYTGEISAGMLKDAGCTWVIIGHSERRQYFAESDGAVAEKLDAALRAGLKPIVCVGETLIQREAGDTLRVVRLQVDAVSPLLAKATLPVAIAYEPVWAIGTGKNARPEDAEEVHLAIRGWLSERDAKLGGGVRILYGGSVKPDNAASLLACPNVDGALVGGASLDAASFGAIARAAAS